mmetsp:Transcript_8157/g.20450  ORF Transcript_8157/g.20450 Transcript_8157/m.20450 type:complete len:714 (-) Transcript_8157:76-2217(-)
MNFGGCHGAQQEHVEVGGVWATAVLTFLTFLAFVPVAADEVVAATHKLLPESFRIRTPDFLDCTGPSYPSVWDEYYALVSKWEAVLLRESAARNGRMWTMDADVHTLGAKVARMSHELLDKWFIHVNRANGTGLDKVLRGHSPPESLEGVCYYGLVQCLWVRALLLMMQPEGGKSLEGLMELETAMAILGDDFRSDYIDSSRWPVRSLDVKMSLQRGRFTKVPKFQVIKNAPQTASGIVFNPTKDFFSINAPRGEEVGERAIQLAAFGTHAALTAEPVTMLRGALHRWKVVAHWYMAQCRRLDPLHHYQCRLYCVIVGECSFIDDPDNLGRRILKMVDYMAEGVGEGDPKGLTPSIATLLDLTAELFQEDPILRIANIVVCTIPLMCSLIRSASMLPVLGYFSMLHYADPAPGFGEWGMMHFAEMAREASRNVFAVTSSLLSDALAEQIGLRLPAVRPFGLYTFGHHVASLFPKPFASLPAHTGSFENSVLVPRSRLAMETSFLHGLRHFVDAVEPTFPLNFTVVRSSKQGDINMALNYRAADARRLGDILSGQENVFVESSSVLLYRAALFLPQMAHTMSLFEMHSMHLPMFIPSRDWLFRLYHQSRFTPMGLQPPQAGQYRYMRPPMFDTNLWSPDFKDPLAYWIFLYDRRFETELPGVHTFETFPDLLRKLLVSDFDHIREAMRKHNEAAFEVTTGWYRSAVLHLLGLVS